MRSADYVEVLGELREQLVPFKASSLYSEIVGNKEAVFARFQPVFSLSNASTISADEFLSFLPFRNNMHWTGLHRQGPRMVADMEKLRRALGNLLNEDRPVSERLEQATTTVFGMGKNIATAILLVAFPHKYGVWNNRSEAVLRRLGVWPEFERGLSRGERYVRVNELLLRLSGDLGIDLWTLDTLWWFLDEQRGDGPADEALEETPAAETFVIRPDADQPASQHFGLERHLHAFLRDNWNSLDLAKDWQIFGEPGDEEIGVEYPTDVGRIDLLARHAREPRWLIIELKRNQSADQTVGQVLRYMGWVKKHLAGPDDHVGGLIISRSTERSLPYALAMVSDVDVRTYEVEFKLSPPEKTA